MFFADRWGAFGTDSQVELRMMIDFGIISSLKIFGLQRQKEASI
jgi:hypothetical protein